MPSNSTTETASAIEQYRQAKNDYLRLRNQAKKELLARFHQAANELFQIQQELLEDFGEKVAIPARGKKSRPAKSAKPTERKPHAADAKPPSQPAAVSPQVASLQQQLQKARKKLAETQAAGKPTKASEDRIYELEDAIRLAQAK